MNILLASTYESGFQPLSIATAAGHLLQNGVSPETLDVYVEGIDKEKIGRADFVGISVPLFSSLMSSVELAKMIRQANPRAHISFFGHYATLNAKRLLETSCDSCIYGEWGVPLVHLVRYLSGNREVSLEGICTRSQWSAPFTKRLSAPVPARHLLPPLEKYRSASWISAGLAADRIAGNVELNRGCHHDCNYCSIYAVYGVAVITNDEKVVLEDIENLVRAGANHITFVDAEFLNMRQRALSVVRKMKQLFPFLTFDITTRMDHILESKQLIREFKGLGCEYITSALEFPKDEILQSMSKRLTVKQIEEAVEFCKEIGIKLNPTFILFNPWASFEDLEVFLSFLERTGLDAWTDPIQYKTRLLLYKGSPLLATPYVHRLEMIEKEFHYDWKHPDTRVDDLYHKVADQSDEIFQRCCIKC